MTKRGATGPVARAQAAEQRAAPAKPSIFVQPPPKWQFSNEKAPIETDRTGRRARKVIWTR